MTNIIVENIKYANNIVKNLSCNSKNLRVCTYFSLAKLEILFYPTVVPPAKELKVWLTTRQRGLHTPAPSILIHPSLR